MQRAVQFSYSARAHQEAWRQIPSGARPRSRMWGGSMVGLVLLKPTMRPPQQNHSSEDRDRADRPIREAQ
jgi:hypothetical protein